MSQVGESAGGASPGSDKNQSGKLKVKVLNRCTHDPIEGVEHGSSEDYLSIMRANLAALQRANGCKVAS